MTMLLWVAMGGAIGAAGRHLVAGQALKLMGPNFPWGTLAVNVVGSCVMGILIALMAHRITLSPEIRSFLTTGILGGFTTFSAFSLDVAVMVERKAMSLAALYIAGSVLLSIAALFFGLWLIRTMLQ